MMNSVCVIGRLTKDVDIRYGAQSQTAVGRFTIAVDRGKDKDGNDKGTDFPSIVCFGKTAELCEKYLSKGRMVGIEGRIQTGAYEKDGRKVYTTDVVADRITFIDTSKASKTEEDDTPEGFSRLDEDIPF